MDATNASPGQMGRMQITLVCRIQCRRAGLYCSAWQGAEKPILLKNLSAPCDKNWLPGSGLFPIAAATRSVVWVGSARLHYITGRTEGDLNGNQGFRGSTAP